MTTRPTSCNATSRSRGRSTPHPPRSSGRGPTRTTSGGSTTTLNPVPSEPIELDLSVGGVWRQYMVIDEDTAYFTGGVYLEIVPDEKLVFAWGATDGWPKLDPDDLDGSPTVSVILTASRRPYRVDAPRRAAGGTAGRRAAGMVVDVREGWRDTVDRLAARGAIRAR